MDLHEANQRMSGSSGSGTPMAAVPPGAASPAEAARLRRTIEELRARLDGRSPVLEVSQ